MSESSDGTDGSPCDSEHQLTRVFVIAFSGTIGLSTTAIALLSLFFLIRYRRSLPKDKQSTALLHNVQIWYFVVCSIYGCALPMSQITECEILRVPESTMDAIYGGTGTVCKVSVHLDSSENHIGYFLAVLIRFHPKKTPHENTLCDLSECTKCTIRVH